MSLYYTDAASSVGYWGRIGVADGYKPVGHQRKMEYIWKELLALPSQQHSTPGDTTGHTKILFHCDNQAVMDI